MMDMNPDFRENIGVDIPGSLAQGYQRGGGDFAGPLPDMSPIQAMQADPRFQALDKLQQDALVQAAMKRLGATAPASAPAVEERTPPKNEEPSYLDLVGSAMQQHNPVADVKSGGPTVARIMGPVLGGLAGGTGGAMLGGMGTEALVRFLQGKNFDPNEVAKAGELQAISAIPGKILGAATRVGAAKAGLTPPAQGTVDLSKLAQTAEDVSGRGGLAPAASKNAADTIKEWLAAAENKLPVNSQVGPSVEKIREGLPYRRVGGADMYGDLRKAVADQAPQYDQLLRAYRAMHALGGAPTMKEILGAGVLGSASGGGSYYTGHSPWLGVLGALLPRLFNAARYAPPEPILSGALGGAANAATQ